MALPVIIHWDHISNERGKLQIPLTIARDTTEPFHTLISGVIYFTIVEISLCMFQK